MCELWYYSKITNAFFKNLWNDPKESNWNVNMRELRKAVMGSIEEHAEALDSSSEELAEKALNHVMAKDKVMTFRYSSSDTLKVSNFNFNITTVLF